MPGTQTPKEEGLSQPPTREGWTESPQKVEGEEEVIIEVIEEHHGLSQKAETR